ncbi:MAG TPA: hypothetical protein VKT54_04855 [Steroidobacteraceae bacterium]|nr:hypothetical protein [Steroidobacteraceae bacterium]
MTAGLPPLLAVTALVGHMASATATPQADDACRTFKPVSGGSLISAAFSVDAQRHAVISPPQCPGGEELLWIRPLRLNPDEYLILQKCASADCSKAEVVRAWNSNGTMGPYPVLTPKIPIDAGARYLLWMARVAVSGNHTFREIEREGRPLVFLPFGSLLELPWAREALEAANARGPTPVQRSTEKGSAYVATFQGGSSVWMRAMRRQARSPEP